MGYNNCVWTLPSATPVLVITNTYTSANASDINAYYRFVYVCLDFLNRDNMSSNGSVGAIKNVAARIPLSSYNTLCYWETPMQPLSLIDIDLDRMNYQNLHIYFLDQRLQPVSFNGVENQVLIKFVKM